MGIGTGLYMYDAIIKTFTFAISCTDECLLEIDTVRSIIFKTLVKSSVISCLWCCVNNPNFISMSSIIYAYNL